MRNTFNMFTETLEHLADLNTGATAICKATANTWQDAVSGLNNGRELETGRLLKRSWGNWKDKFRLSLLHAVKREEVGVLDSVFQA